LRLISIKEKCGIFKVLKPTANLHQNSLVGLKAYVEILILLIVQKSQFQNLIFDHTTSS